MATAIATQSVGKADKRHKTAMAVASTHKDRTLCYAILGERIASPAEISRELLIEVNRIGYHIRLLCEWGLVEEVDRRKVRGATEHFFKAVELRELTAEEEEALTPAERRQFAETVLSWFQADAVRSIDEELLYGRTDHYLTRLSYDVDDQGWQETYEAFQDCFDRVQAVRRSTEIRLEENREAGETVEKPLRLTTFLGQFEVPPLRTPAFLTESS